MKNVKQLIEEKNKYLEKIQSLKKDIENFTKEKPVGLTNQQYKELRELKEKNETSYNDIKEALNKTFIKNLAELDTIKEEKEIYMMAHNVIDINIHHAFEAEYKEKIIAILNKYKGRKVGEKTKEKIREEIKALDTDVIQSVALRIEYKYICVYIKNTNIEIEIHKADNDNWLNDGAKEKINDLRVYGCDKYSYIENVIQFAKEKLGEKKTLEAFISEEMKTIREKIRQYNNFYSVNDNFKISEYRL